jgi:hypothetical protein
MTRGEASRRACIANGGVWEKSWALTGSRKFEL